MLFLGAGMSDRDKQTAVLRFSDKLGLVTQKLANFRKRAANFRKSKFPKFDMKIGEIAILAKLCPFLGGSILAPKPMFGPDRPPRDLFQVGPGAANRGQRAAFRLQKASLALAEAPAARSQGASGGQNGPFGPFAGSGPWAPTQPKGGVGDSKKSAPGWPPQNVF